MQYILSAASNLTVDQLRPFLASAYRHIPDAHVRLFVHRADRAKEQALKKVNPNVELVFMQDEWARRLLWLSPK